MPLTDKDALDYLIQNCQVDQDLLSRCNIEFLTALEKIRELAGSTTGASNGLRALLEYCSPSKENLTQLLEIAVESGNAKAVQTMLVYYKTRMYHTYYYVNLNGLLEIAVREKNKDIVAMLVNYGANAKLLIGLLM